MRPIFGTKMNDVNTTYLLTPYGAQTLFTYGNLGTGSFNTSSGGGTTCVQFGSKIYNMYNGGLYEYDTISEVNTLIRSFSGYPGSASREQNCGIFIHNVSGTWYMVCFYPGSGNNSYCDRFNFTTQAWSTSSGFANHGLNSFNTYKYQFGSSIMFFVGDTSFTTSPSTIQLNIETNVAASISGPTNAYTNSLSMGRFNSSIYALGRQSGLKLWQLIGGSWQVAKTINATDMTTDTRTMLFTDGTYFYAFAYYAATGWRVWQLDGGLNATEISSTVLPTYLTSNTNLSASQFKGVHIDSHADPANPEIWLAYTSASSTTASALSWFRWMGPAGQIQYAGDSGEGGFDFFIGYSVDGGGQAIYSPGEPNIQIEGELTAAATAGNVDVPFKVYESNNVPSGVLVDVNLYYSTTPHPPRSLGRITNVTPSGEIIDANTVRVIAGSGQLWGLEWRSAADGVEVGEQVSLTLYASRADI